MTSKRGKAGTGTWKGEAVEDAPGAEAELAADRAEGNSPVPAEVEQERIRAPAAEQQPERAQRRPPHTDDPEEEIRDTAEEHQARREAGERPPRGKL
ncbi:MAG TPA: hypothetical protein VLR69_02000 [Thermoanaerobaculia bacterium]|nr:hypothetical protein [Thermoanaerobaculia bacterium]